MTDWLIPSYLSLFLIDLGKSRDYCIPRGLRSRVSGHSSTLHVERSLHLSNYFDWQPRFDTPAHGCTQQPLRCCRISFGTGKWKTQCSLCPERLKISAKQNTSVLNNYSFSWLPHLIRKGPTLHYCCVTLRGAMLCSISWFVVLGCVYVVVCSVLLYFVRKLYILIKLNWFVSCLGCFSWPSWQTLPHPSLLSGQWRWDRFCSSADKRWCWRDSEGCGFEILRESGRGAHSYFGSIASGIHNIIIVKRYYLTKEGGTSVTDLVKPWFCLELESSPL